MTRITGSVPEGRTTSLPCAPSFDLPSVIARCTVKSSNDCLFLYRTFFAICRQGLEGIADITDTLAAAPHNHFENLQRRDQAITRRGEIRQHQMATLFAADIKTMLAHMINHVAISHRRSLEFQASLVQIAL